MRHVRLVRVLGVLFAAAVTLALSLAISGPGAAATGKRAALPTDAPGLALPTDRPGLALPTDAPGLALPTDRPGLALPTDRPGLALPTDTPRRA